MALERGYCAECLKAEGPKAIPTLSDHHREWRTLYDKARWRHPLTGLRACILRRDPICKQCGRNPSTIADHKIDHRGNEVLFWNANNLRGICKECHDVKTGLEHPNRARKSGPPSALDANGRIRNS